MTPWPDSQAVQELQGDTKSSGYSQKQEVSEELRIQQAHKQDPPPWSRIRTCKCPDGRKVSDVTAKDVKETARSNRTP